MLARAPHVGRGRCATPKLLRDVYDNAHSSHIPLSILSASSKVSCLRASRPVCSCWLQWHSISERSAGPGAGPWCHKEVLWQRLCLGSQFSFVRGVRPYDQNVVFVLVEDERGSKNSRLPVVLVGSIAEAKEQQRENKCINKQLIEHMCHINTIFHIEVYRRF